MAEVSDFTVAILKFSFLALLWLFVFSAVGVMRRDLFGGGEPAPSAGVARAGLAPAAGGKATKGKQAQASPGPAPTHIVIVQGQGQGTTTPLGAQPLTIGRGGNSNVVIADDYASTHHARLYPRAGQWFIEDLNSTNGTFIGRQRVDGPIAVSVGTQIRIGNTVLELGK